MFEKFSYSDVDSAGQGGEYTVQAGFGWTNGVLLWATANYGNILNAPDCPPLLSSSTSTKSASVRVEPASKAIALLATIFGGVVLALL